jgi:phage-related protein
MKINMLVTFYETARGDRPVEEYIDDLSAKEAAKVLDALAAIEAHGMEVVVTRQIKGKLWELKVSATRVFYVLVTGPEVVLLHAYKKQGQKARLKEIETAERRMKEVLAERG